MMKIDLLDAATLGDDLDFSLFRQWGELTVHACVERDELPSLLKNTEIVITNKLVFSREVIQQLPRLQLICLTATGYNNVDIDAARERGVAVANVAGYSTESVAQHTFSMLLSLLEHISWYDHFVKSGEYQQAPVFTNVSRPWFQLKGKKWGIIGLGNIGRRIAELAQAFGCDVSYFSTSGVERPEPWPRKELAALLQENQIVSIHAPLTEQTRSLIGTEQFKLMGKDAYLLNLGRGPIVDEEALARALESGEIAGAALDVFTREPVKPENPLLHINCPDKLLMTPHNAWGSIEARTLLMQEISHNIEAFLKGEKRNRIV